MRTLTITGFGIRLAFALALVFATYNPSGFSFYHLVVNYAENSVGFPMLGLFGILLLIGWVMYVRATIRSLGIIGVILVAALFGFILWVALDVGILSLENPDAVTVVILIILAIILAVGMSWSHIRRRLSGQADMDDVDD